MVVYFPGFRRNEIRRFAGTVRVFESQAGLFEAVRSRKYTRELVRVRRFREVQKRGRVFISYLHEGPLERGIWENFGERGAKFRVLLLLPAERKCARASAQE